MLGGDMVIETIVSKTFLWQYLSSISSPNIVILGLYESILPSYHQAMENYWEMPLLLPCRHQHTE